MPNCPHCNKVITHISRHSTIRRTVDFYLENGMIHSKEVESKEDDFVCYCPECGGELAFIRSMEQATDFLKIPGSERGKG